MLDVAFIAPNNSEKIYQSLSSNLSAIEPPTWALLLAEACRKSGFKVSILDTLAENMSDHELENKIHYLKPRLVCFVAYGQNVNAGTTSMSGVARQSNAIKKSGYCGKISIVGSHVQALPKETLEKENSVDFVFLGEGVYSILEILKKTDLSKESLLECEGIAFRDGDRVVFTKSSKPVNGSDMDIDLPGYAWDLLPYRKKPFDLYRSPLWHANYIDEDRSPYAAIQTSLGCQFKCSFCMINLINKDDSSEISLASNYNRMRHWSVDTVNNQFKKLVEMGVKTIRVTDEMFFLNKKYYVPIIRNLVKLNKKDDLKLWAYSRIDTVPNPELLKEIRKAGFRWLCLGIESGDKEIRLEVAKGKFEQVDVKKVVKQIEEADINVLANYIYGLPGDNHESIENTYQLSVELNTLGWNTYAAMALPGTPLYSSAKANGLKLPENYEDFSFHSYSALPLPTEDLKAYQVLEKRDRNFHRYFERKEFLDKLEKSFGSCAKQNVLTMLEKKLTRKIIEEKSA